MYRREGEYEVRKVKEGDVWREDEGGERVEEVGKDRQMECGRREVKGSFETRPSEESERLGGKNAIMSH